MNTMYEKVQDDIIRLADRANNGDMNYLDAVIQLEEKRKYLEDALEIIKQFKRSNSEEIKFLSDEYPDGYKGYKIEVRNGRKTYDFKGVPEWVDKNQELKNLEKKYKAALNAKINGLAYANVTEEGEEIPLPEINYAASSVIVKPARS